MQGDFVNFQHSHPSKQTDFLFFKVNTLCSVIWIYLLLFKKKYLKNNTLLKHKLIIIIKIN